MSLSPDIAEHLACTHLPPHAAARCMCVSRSWHGLFGAPTLWGVYLRALGYHRVRKRAHHCCDDSPCVLYDLDTFTLAERSDAPNTVCVRHDHYPTVHAPVPFSPPLRNVKAIFESRLYTIMKRRYPELSLRTRGDTEFFVDHRGNLLKRLRIHRAVRRFLHGLGANNAVAHVDHSVHLTRRRIAFCTRYIKRAVQLQARRERFERTFRFIIAREEPVRRTRALRSIITRCRNRLEAGAQGGEEAAYLRSSIEVSSRELGSMVS